MSEPDEAFDFRPLTAEDLPLLHGWLNAPHARRWFGDRRTKPQIADMYVPIIAGREPSKAYVVTLSGQPVGLVEWERMGDSPEFQRRYEVEDPNAANCDVLLGEPSAAHRGLGPTMIRAFLKTIVFADPRITTCIIDPVPDNHIAIRAYEKVGFRFRAALPDDGEGNALYLMELKREELFSGPAPEGEITIRPAREDELSIAEDIDDEGDLLYAEHGLHIDVTAAPEMFERELQRWGESLREGRLLFACAKDGEPVGFIAFGFVDGKPHLQQVSVMREWMRRGIGRSLVRRIQHWSVRPGELWLTTYDHLPFNRPFYENMGFVRVPESECGPEMRAILEEERAALPSPERRIAMVYRHR